MNFEPFLHAGTLAFIEEKYEQYLNNQDSVEQEWRLYFEQYKKESHNSNFVESFSPKSNTRSIFNTHSIFEKTADAQSFSTKIASTQDLNNSNITNQALANSLSKLVDAYRREGHLEANLDPLALKHINKNQTLTHEYYGISSSDMKTYIKKDILNINNKNTSEQIKVEDIIDAIKKTYAESVGAEFMHLSSEKERTWLSEKMESFQNRISLTRENAIRIFDHLSAAEGLENFLQKKFVGTKRFSLEGAESLIPLLDSIICTSADNSIQEIVMGMPHRGRLNVLTNILQQDPTRLFAQFEDVDPISTLGSGDVKYHLGYSSDYKTTSAKNVHLTLTCNPSHLEAVDPVVEGRTRAKQDRINDKNHEKILPLLIHGDAAFIGQGLVLETLNLSQLEGYKTGGTIHVVVNNQIGFTTFPESSRSTRYCTDIAKTIDVPIFHVNAEDLPALIYIAQLCVLYRQEFKKDIVIDMYCYRKYGHNETDEPRFTQPVMYKKIDSHISINKKFSQQMIEKGLFTGKDAEDIITKHRNNFDKALHQMREQPKAARMPSMGGLWADYFGGADSSVPKVDTSITKEELSSISMQLVSVPPTFHPHLKIVKLLAQRREMLEGHTPIDWGMGETLAFATLVSNGYNVRLSGQDCGRGTFSHRHAVLSDTMNGSMYIPLQHLKENQARFEVYNSSLSEAGVMGFDYGYSLDYPEALVIWEAQFGDFANGAQIIIDQFLASAEDKWKRLSGLTLLLPHGYEGQGPEHSSARLERYLQLCARDNIQVCYPTTPAQIFHLLRRQVIRKIRKPLIIMSPKSLLRHKDAVSSLSDLFSSNFLRVIEDGTVEDINSVKQIIFCTGKVFYDLFEERQKRAIQNVAIIRIEQLYPLPEDEILSNIRKYQNLKEILWVQEEPKNMGAWEFIRNRLEMLLGPKYNINCQSRPEAASPATGSHKAHHIELHLLMDNVFGKKIGV